MQAGHARLGERMRGQLVGDLEALGLGVGRCSTRATVSGGTSIPGTLVATNRIPPTVRRMQIDGISAIRSLSPVVVGDAHEPLEQLGAVAELQLQEARAGVSAFFAARRTRYSSGGAPGFSTAPTKKCGGRSIGRPER